MKKSQLDATDLRILEAVQNHGQLSKTRLAEIVNLSPTPCWARLDRLKTEGFIRGYHGDIDLGRITDFTKIFVSVSLLHHRKSDFARFEALVRARDEIVECTATGGGVDYILKIIVSDPELGTVKYGLSEKGRKQVETSASELKKSIRNCIIISSDFRRALETAEIIKASRPNIGNLVRRRRR